MRQKLVLLWMVTLLFVVGVLMTFYSMPAQRKPKTVQPRVQKVDPTKKLIELNEPPPGASDEFERPQSRDERDPIPESEPHPRYRDDDRYDKDRYDERDNSVPREEARSKNSRASLRGHKCRSLKGKRLVGGRFIAVGKPIGKGAFGEVYRAVDEDCKVFAIKEMKRTTTDEDNACDSKVECMHGMIMNHPSVMKCFEVSTEDDGKMWIVMQLAAQIPLSKTLTRVEVRPTVNQVRSIARQIIEGVQYIHRAGYSHHDLKSANIGLKPLVDKNGQLINYKAYVLDLGAPMRCWSWPSVDTRDKSGVTTHSWSPPDWPHVAFPPGEECGKFDLFQVGEIIASMVTGSKSIFGEHAVVNGCYRFAPRNGAVDKLRFFQCMTWTKARIMSTPLVESSRDDAYDLNVKLPRTKKSHPFVPPVYVEQRLEKLEKLNSPAWEPMAKRYAEIFSEEDAYMKSISCSVRTWIPRPAGNETGMPLNRISSNLHNMPRNANITDKAVSLKHLDNVLRTSVRSQYNVFMYELARIGKEDPLPVYDPEDTFDPERDEFGTDDPENPAAKQFGNDIPEDLYAFQDKMEDMYNKRIEDRKRALREHGLSPSEIKKDNQLSTIPTDAYNDVIKVEIKFGKDRWAMRDNFNADQRADMTSDEGDSLLNVLHDFLQVNWRDRPNLETVLDDPKYCLFFQTCNRTAKEKEAARGASLNSLGVEFEQRTYKELDQEGPEYEEESDEEFLSETPSTPFAK